MVKISLVSLAVLLNLVFISYKENAQIKWFVFFLKVMEAHVVISLLTSMIVCWYLNYLWMYQRNSVEVPIMSHTCWYPMCATSPLSLSSITKFCNYNYIKGGASMYLMLSTWVAILTIKYTLLSVVIEGRPASVKMLSGSECYVSSKPCKQANSTSLALMYVMLESWNVDAF